ncbi:RHS repeat-associated core domain-containing protein [Actinokineospora globicatena]|uniref:RHS repeat-associated core domain-containing protein n=1 Tax=Actinokineospora globicatena TaxID=103729 RepID=UPI002555208B|nr:RHS repeat-associated core domain-containing protein [Actinokineospora globicatena]MCP2303843.1 RHS repeat-associated core domain-containing protein [Actinokineospora globicatena]
MTPVNSSTVRKRGVLGRLATTLVIVAVTIGLVGPSFPSPVPDLSDGERALAEAMGLAPRQAWGEASAEAGGSAAPTPAEIGNPNQAASVSLQSKYPPIAGQSAEPAANTVRVEQAESTVRGYDKASSREVPQQRGRRERTFRNADGTLTTEFSRDPINYQAPDGTWRPVDTAIADAGREGWRNGADGVGLGFSRTADAERLVRVRFDDGHEFAYGLRGATASAGVVAGSTITYPGVLPGADLRLDSQAGGVKETMVLASPDAPHSWLFPLRLRGLTAAVVDNRVVLTDERGVERGVVPAGYMTDSAVNPRTGDPATSTGVRYSIVDDTAAGPALKVDLDSAWLRDPARRYPVLVDPSVEQATATSTLVVQGGGRTTGPADLRVGFNGTENAATYLAFPDIENRLRNHRVFGAQLYLTNYWSWSCAPRSVTVHGVTQPWGSSGGYPGPSVGPALTGASFAHGYIGLEQTGSSCPTAAEVVDLGVAGRDLVQRWVNGEQPNHGLSVRASETEPYAWKKFAGQGTANPPRLFVTHTEYDAEYRIDRGVPEPPVHALQGGYVKITVTNRGAQTWTPSTFALGHRAFTAQGTPFATVESAQLPGDVPRGASVTLDAFIPAMPVGEYVLDFSVLRKGGPWFTDEQIPPARLTFRVVNIRPIVKAQYPPNGYSAQTLTPQLWVDAVDVDSPPDRKPQYRFEVCEDYVNDVGTNCTGSGYVNDRTWSVPVGALRWSKDYQWRAFGYDGTAESVALPPSHLLTAVPQPEITSHLANAPYGGTDQDFDAQTGNYHTAAADAVVTVTGPPLDVTRSYNSLDPRRDLAFGAGWSTRYDMRAVPDDDGSGNVVVTYPDGQQVRFGRNADGSFSPPQGRYANFRAEVVESGGWALVDKAFTAYRFRADGKLVQVVDEAGNRVEIAYDTSGRISTATNRTSERALTFAYTGGHVTSVATDVIDGRRLTWTYTYSGDELTKVCDPRGGCTTYEYGTGSHYRSAVADSRPASYWRLGDPQGTKAESQVRTNLGKDDGIATDVTPTGGAISGTTDGAGDFNGTSSVVKLADGLVRKNRDLSIELWFRTTTGGPLFGYQQQDISTTSAGAVPALYIGQDGKLRGQFWNGGAHPITSAGTVNDGQWHHAVLSGSLATQTLFLDGVAVGTQLGEIAHPDALHSQIGAAYTVPPGAWESWGTDARRFFRGQIDEVAYYEHPLGATAVRAHFQARAPAAQLTSVTTPSGRVQARMSYDAGADRLTDYTDDNGGLWRLATPVVTGTPENLVRTTRVTDPGNRHHFYDFDPQRGRILRYVAPLGLSTRDEDARDPAGAPTTPPAPTCPTGPSDTPPSYCGGAGTPNGGWIGGPVNGQGVRTFDYDAQGFQSTITDENGSAVVLVNDARGNLLSRKSCRVAPNDCQTAYSNYYLNPADLTDPRNDKLTESRDARSSGPTDNRYLTTYAYTGTGKRGLLEKRTAADGGVTSRAYTDASGGTPAFDTGSAPAGLVASTKDSRGAVVTYRYFRNGDLAEEKSTATGLTTRYTYDALGRLASQTQISDTYPLGLRTTFAHDELSRRTSTTEPATTDAITGTKHTLRTTAVHDADGRTTRVDVADLTGGDATRTTTNGYDDHGRLSAVTDAEGGQTSHGYDVFGNRVWTVDAGGDKYEFAYTARNKVSEVRLRSWHGDPVPAGGGTGGDGDGPKAPGTTLVLRAHTYDLAGRLLRETDAMGRTTRYEYYADGLVRRVVARGVRDPLDQNAPARDIVLEDNTYDGAGNAIKQVTPGNRVVTNEFDAVGRVSATALDPAGLNRRTEFRYDTEGNRTQEKRTGASSNSARVDTSRVELTDLVYDSSGKLTQRRVSNGPKVLVSVFGYDQRGLLRTATDPRGAGYTTDYGYDEHGNAVSVTAPAVQVESGGGAPSSTRPVTLVGRNTFGEPTAAKDANGRITTTAVDRLGRTVRTESPDYTRPGETTPGRAVVTTKYDALDRPTEVTDPLGAVTRLRYDQLGRLRERHLPAPGGTWSYSYTRVGEQLSATDPTGSRVEATYDDLGRQVTATQLERTPTPAAFTTRFGHDDADNLVRVTSPTGDVTQHGYDVLGRRTSSTDPAGVVTQFGYDLAGNQVRVSDGLGRTRFTKIDAAGGVTGIYDLDPAGRILRQSTAKYDDAGNQVESRDALGAVTKWEYDAGNRLTRQVEPVADGRAITTSFGYDAVGNRTRYTDGRGNATIQTVNSLGLAESVVEPATAAHPAATDRTWTTSYDLAGNAIQVRAPGGITRTTTFDALGQPRTETGSGAEEATTTRVFDFDTAGRLTGVSAPGGTNVLSRNDRGALVAATGPSGNSSFVYDAAGRLTARTDASGTTTATYGLGRLAAVRDGATGTTRTLSYDGAGQVSSVNLGAGNARDYVYDDFGRLKTDTVRGGTTAVTATAYGYDLVDRVKTRGVTTGPTTTADAYDYDQSGRLVKWTVNGTATAYEWDDAGNRTKAGAKVSTYDQRGRLLSDGDATYTWSARGTMTGRTAAGTTRPYGFDAFDRGVRQGSTTYAYDGLDRAVAPGFSYIGTSRDLAADSTTTYSRGPDGNLLSLARGPDRRTLLTDQHGDVVGGFDPATQISGLNETTSYDPFGQVRTSTGTRPSLGFQSDWTDPATGHVDMGARWYDPTQGRFTARDSIDLPTTPSTRANRYTYGAADPVGNDDPTGHLNCGTGGGTWLEVGLQGICTVATSTAVTSATKFATRKLPVIGWPLTAYDLYTDLRTGPETSGHRGAVVVPKPRVVAPTEEKPEVGEKGDEEVGDEGIGLPPPVPPGIAARIAAEGSVFNERVPLVPGAADPRYADGRTSSGSDSPSNRVGAGEYGVQDEDEVNRRIRDTLLDGALDIIKDIVEGPLSELDSADTTHIYEDGNVYRVVRDADGRLVRVELVVGGRGGGRAGALAKIDPNKFNYLFGKVKEDDHNTPRALQNKRQFARIGIHDSPEGRALIEQHLRGTVGSPDNILESYVNEHGSFQVRESLLAGPNGFLVLKTTWEVLDDSLRLTTVIPVGG